MKKIFLIISLVLMFASNVFANISEEAEEYAIQEINVEKIEEIQEINSIDGDIDYYNAYYDENGNFVEEMVFIKKDIKETRAGESYGTLNITKVDNFEFTSGEKGNVTASGIFYFNSANNTATVSSVKNTYSKPSSVTYTKLDSYSKNNAVTFTKYAQVYHKGQFETPYGMKNTCTAKIKVTLKGAVSY